VVRLRLPSRSELWFSLYLLASVIGNLKEDIFIAPCVTRMVHHATLKPLSVFSAALSAARVLLTCLPRCCARDSGSVLASLSGKSSRFLVSSYKLEERAHAC